MFIEADGQQPFYVKRTDTLYSSSAAGFLIIPKVPKGDFNIVLGFPKAVYPEVSFDLKEVSRDRGFYLKLFEGKGWGLLDRTSMEVFYSNNREDVRPTADSIKKKSSQFAELLSDATGDKLLLQQPVVDNKPTNKESPIEQKKSEQANLPKVKDKSGLSVVIKFEDLETDQEKILTFIDRAVEGTSDTIKLKIEKITQVELIPLQQTLSQDSAVIRNVDGIKSQENISAVKSDDDTKKAVETKTVVARKLADCNKPIADSRDLLNLQKKLLGITSVEDQIAYVEKIFGMKCFSSKQSIEIASYFLEEQSRLNLFTKIYWLLKEHNDFNQAGTLFFRDENIKAFKQLQSGN